MADEEVPAVAPEVKTVAQDKYERVVAAKRGLEEQVENLKAENSSLSEKIVGFDAMAGQLEELRAGKADAEGKFERWKTIGGAVGSTEPDVIEAFEWQHGRLPAEDRPPLGDWIASLKEDPTAAPVVLRSFLGTAQPQPADKPKPRVVPGAGHEDGPSAGATFSKEEIRAAKEAGQAGDWSQWKRMRKAMSPDA